MRIRRRWLLGTQSYIVFHIFGLVLLAVVAAIFPSVGPNRFVLAAVLVLVVAPLAVVVQYRFPAAEYGWSEPLFNVAFISILVHLTPAAWMAALVVGLLVAAISSIRVEARGYLLCLGLNLLHVTGMTVAALVHGVQGWALPIAAILATLPCTTYYAYWEYAHVAALKDRARRMQDLTVIAGGVAHDFRNLLTAVAGYAELARRELARGHPARGPVDELRRGAERASMLAGQLLAFSGGEVGPSSELNLADEIGTLTGLLRTVVPEGVEVKIDAPARLPTVYGDPARLQQVVMNLVLNACEASEETPSTVRIGLWHEPWKKSKAGRVVCEVRDRGAGISAEHLPRVFDPFFTSKARGHGLGLTGVQRILADHDGDIEIESEIGEGTRVRFWLPATSFDGSATSSDGSATSSGNGTPTSPGHRVLVIDDEAQIRDVLGRFLERLGYESLEVRDGFEGVERFREHASSVGVVIMDVKMPGMDGWRCSEEIRRIRPDVPIILSTAYDPDPPGEPPDLMTFLPKPYHFHDLERTLEQVGTTTAAP